jgi:hypothetical protein
MSRHQYNPRSDGPMGEFTMTERTIFLDALEKTDPAEQAAFLEQACGGNDQLRQHVQQLIQALDEAGTFMALPPARADASADDVHRSSTGSRLAATESQPVVEPAGARIGAYKFLERIGEGGMGVVSMRTTGSRFIAVPCSAMRSFARRNSPRPSRSCSPATRE